jgi:hypothetical protein
VPVIQQRRAHPDSSRNDLLDRLLNGRDPKTGEGLTDENIVHQLITFLIAGQSIRSCIHAMSLTRCCVLQVTKRPLVHFCRDVPDGRWG